jgi:hypothetical protein
LSGSGNTPTLRFSGKNVVAHCLLVIHKSMAREEKKSKYMYFVIVKDQRTVNLVVIH